MEQQTMAMTTIKTKTNHYIGKKGAQTIYYAAEVARYIHCPLNYFVTINFKETNISVANIYKDFHHIKKQLCQWMRFSSKCKKAFEPTFVWVFENSIDKKGCYDLDDENHHIHVHWAMHIPKGYEEEVKDKIIKCLKQKTPINDRTVYLGDTYRNPSLSYILKGCRKEIMKIYGRGREASDQGLLFGERRSGTTRNISQKARKEMDKALGKVRAYPDWM